MLLSGAARAKIVGRRAKGLMASLEGWSEVVGLVLRASAKTGFAANIDRNGLDFWANRAQFGGANTTAAHTQPQSSVLQKTLRAKSLHGGRAR